MQIECWFTYFIEDSSVEMPEGKHMMLTLYRIIIKNHVFATKLLPYMLVLNCLYILALFEK